MLLRKVLFLGLIALSLLVPLGAITHLVEERSRRADEAVAEVGTTWGGPQRLAGPALEVPIERTGPNGTVFTRLTTLLPSDYAIRGVIEPETRRRGPYSVVVYRGDLVVDGSFDPARLELEAGEVPRWAAARVVAGLGDLRGLAAVPSLTLGDAELALDAEPDLSAPWRSGLAATGLAPLVRETPFRLGLRLGGTRELMVLPLGEDTRLALRSPWTDPSFQGAYLPTERTVGTEGFDAIWTVPRFSRAFPQSWTGDVAPRTLHAIDRAAFGVALLQPAGFYQQVARCTKYAALFVVLTFCVVLLFEVLSGVRVHPVQYLLVGSAVALFYLLLLAFAERIGFDGAYAVGAGAIVALLSAYSRAIFGDGRRAAWLGTSIAVLYATLFVLVRLETFALLAGSLLLLAILALVMWTTRDLDWYRAVPTTGAAPSTAERNPVARTGA